ncbi:hypothetical protein [Piscibacillus halophilus]|uniref:hypothetical protein n=1 Tax=Piscibacillus halophilus TaxID=571933 RepID=UPI00158A763D|nr:hypothetical protein [Piscibacillus halophilus]
MIKKSLFILIITVLMTGAFNQSILNAYTEETYNVITDYNYRLGSDSPFSDYDVLEPIYPQSVYRVEVVNLDIGTTQETEGTHDGRMHGLACNDSYKMTTYDSSGNQIGVDYVTVTDLKREQPAIECGNDDPYIDKLDEIISKIPPPPDWDAVSGTFASKFENMLGAAPEPADITQPAQPSQPAAPESIPEPEEPTANIDDQNINDKTPEFQESEGLDESTFTEDDLEQSAEEIEFREDEEGGFEINDPVDSLPDFPTDDLPKPDETDAGEYGEHQPDQEVIEFPDDPQDGEGEPIPETPPKPDETEEAPPQPNEDYTAPTPEDSGGGDPDGSEYYKESPDIQTGSGL